MALRYFLTLDVFDDDGQLVHRNSSAVTAHEFIALRVIDLEELEALPDAAHIHFLEQARAGIDPAEALEAAKAFVGNVN